MSEAGGHADGKFRELRRDYLYSHRRIRRTLMGLGVLLMVTGLLLIWPGTLRIWLGIIAVYLGTLAMALYASIDTDLPEWVDKWRRGAEGEHRTATELTELPPAWIVRHDLDDKDIEDLKGNVDHFVVGPGGAFVIDSKLWAGERVTVISGQVKVIRIRSGRSSWQGNRSLHRVKGQAWAVRKTLADRKRLSRWVTPVVVAWAESCPAASEIDGVWLVPGPDLRRWLLTRPPVMSEREAELITQAIDNVNPRNHG